MNKNELRECYNNSSFVEYYFHKWVEIGATHTHPYSESGDVCYVATMALVENKLNGNMFLLQPDSLTFSTKPPPHPLSGTD